MSTESQLIGRPHWIRALSYLRDFNPDSYDYIAPDSLTQPGVAQALGISRAHATLVLNDLLKEGLVERRLLYIVSGKRRKYAYLLSCDGYGFVRVFERGRG